MGIDYLFFEDFADRWGISIKVSELPGRIIVDLEELGCAHMTKFGITVPTFPIIIKTEFVKELRKMCQNFHKKYKKLIK